jgi:DNA sulfur modification protein DndB
MIENLFPVEQLRAHARATAKPYAQKSVHPKLVEEETKKGWLIVKEGKVSTRLKRDKPHGNALEDRVWTLLYRMGFDLMSGQGGAKLRLVHQDSSSPSNQLDVVAVDSDVILAIECKSSINYAKRPQFQEELAKLLQMRERLIKSVGSTYPEAQKRHSVIAFFLNNVQLTEPDKERAKTANILLFDEKDLEYYEKLVNHLGPAAKYQMYADMLPGKTIGGLSIRVPAVKSKMGPYNCYTFPASPEYLLKIAYVSHRSKGKASDIHTYQRMIAKSRLKKIREYISDHGIFPTNIVVNIEKKCIDFQRVKQENDQSDRDSSGILGWLNLRPAYKSAWIIDGQHRLYSYSGHPYAKTGHIAVLAFEGIPPSAQAKLFIDINAKQKSVKPSLLQELFAELHWDADSAIVRVQAIVSKAVQVLDGEKDSPFYGRIQTADSMKDSVRCISLTSLFRAIERQGFFIAKEAKGEVIEGGVFWRGTNENTLDRTVYVLKNWFNQIKSGAIEWWDLGSKDGGGLAMNDSVTACIMVLRSVVHHLENNGKKLVRLDNDDLSDNLKPYALALANHFGQMNEEERKRYRDLRGVQGQTTRMRRAQQALKVQFPAFDPTGLQEFLRREKEQTNLRAKAIIDRLEQLLQSIVIQELKQEFTDDGESWWIQGVPRAVRLEVSKRIENDDNKRGSREAYLDLIDYRTIALNQWPLFQQILGYGKKSESKDRQTKWLQEINEMRNVVAHASSGVSLSVEQVTTLESYEQWLRQKAMSDDSDPAGTETNGDEEA